MEDFVTKIAEFFSDYEGNNIEKAKNKLLIQSDFKKWEKLKFSLSFFLFYAIIVNMELYKCSVNYMYYISQENEYEEDYVTNPCLGTFVRIICFCRL